MFGWKKSYVVVKEVFMRPYIKKVYRKNIPHDSKDVARKIIGCEYTDVINYDYNGKTLGMYCNDLATLKDDYNFTYKTDAAYGTIVIMDEFNITSKREANKILKHFIRYLYLEGDDSI